MVEVYAIAQNKVRYAALGEEIAMAGVFTRSHRGHKVYADGQVFHISDESIFGTEWEAKRELNHRRRIWPGAYPPIGAI